MADDAPELILHHYDGSPFSEKIRLALGLKELAWRSVTVPPILPRPHLAPMTGAFRRVPVLQVGADLYCDTQIIVRELERRFPEPSLYPNGEAGLAHMLGGWSDSRLFTAAMIVAIGGMGDALSQAFIEDRENMAGSRFDIRKIRAGLPAMREQLRAQVGWIDEQLADDRSFLFGSAPGWGDINAYFNLWFVRSSAPAEGRVIDGFMRVNEWEARMQAIGHGTLEPLSGEAALEICSNAQPLTEEETDPLEPAALAPGESVTVTPDDYAKAPVAGELVASSAQHIAIRRSDPQAGDVVLHFPRAGYVVSPG